MKRGIGLLAVYILLQGCSSMTNMALYNNSDQPIQVCNLNVSNTPCVTVDPQSMEKIALKSERDSGMVAYSISQQGYTGIYELQGGTMPEYTSSVYCSKLYPRYCDIPVQYEQDSVLYWGGRENRLPYSEIPWQPIGFPVAPGY